jgi:cytoskeletal protein RodZ
MSRRKDAPKVEASETLKGFDDYDVSLGDIMRGERATMGKSLLDVQRDLKIKATYISAIENADTSAFESQGFIAGYVRSYARYLKMDPEWAYQTFCTESGHVAGQGAGMGMAAGKSKSAKSGARSPRPSGVRDPLADPSVSFIPKGDPAFSGVEPRAVGSFVVLAALVAAIGYGGWAVLQEVQKVQFVPVDQAPVVATLDPLGDVTTPAQETAPDRIASAPAPATEGFDRLYRPQALDVPVLVARDGPIGTIDPRSVGSLSTPALVAERDIAAATPDSLPSEPPAPLDTASVAEPESAVQVVQDEPEAVVLFAVRPSWVRVRGADGTVIFEKILDAGERFAIPATEEPPILRAGNSGSVYFSIGDKTYGPAGDGPSVVKDVALSAKTVPAAYALADPEADSDLARFVAVAEAQAATD